MPIDIDYELAVDAKGYRLERGRIVGLGGKPERRMRLKDFPTLYLQFAKVQSPEALLDFTNKFGRLTRDKVQTGKRGLEIGEHGDNARALLQEADTMLKALEIVRGKMGNPPKWEGSFEYEAAGLKFKAIPLRGKLGAQLAPDPTTGAWQLQLQPPSLLDALWLQFGQAVVSNAILRSCAHCGKWFEAGVGSGRRADAKFCSDQCQVKHKSLERSQRRSR